MAPMDICDLPTGWVQGTASDLVLNPKNDIVDGPFGSNLKASEYTDSGTPIVRIQNVKRFHFVDKNIHFVTDEKAKQLKRHSFKAGDVLITKLGEPLGLACIAPNRLEFGIIVADIVRARPYIEVSNKFMTYLLNSRVVIEQISKHTKGSTRARINLSVIRNLDIPIPPLAEQKRIVEKLDSLLAQVDTIKQRLNNLPNIIKRFRQSVLAAAVSGKLTEQWRGGNKTTTNEMVENILMERKQLLKQKIAKDHTLEDSTIVADIPNTWLIEPLGKLTSYITSGSRGWSKFYSEDPKDAKFVRSAEINNDYLRLDEAITVKLPLKVEGKRSLIEKGDLLLTITGANVGKCAHIEEKIPEAYVSQSVALIKSIDPNISRFLHMWLKAKNAGGSQLEEMMYGIGRPVLSLPNIYSIRVGVPPLEEQTEIVRLVEQHFALADTLEKHLKTAKQRVDNLTQSILAKAFKGELVPQDPNDEPAEQLLARIKAARAEAEQLEKAAKKATKKTIKSKV